MESDPSIIDGLIDHQNETAMDVAILRGMGTTLGLPSHQRTHEDMLIFHKLFLKYKLFHDLHLKEGQTALLNVLSHVQLTKVGSGSYLMDQEDTDTRYYAVFKGKVGLEQAEERTVPYFDQILGFHHRLYAYLQCLY